MPLQYTIRHTATMLMDSPQHIDFHIRTGDYFSYLATMMGFFEEVLSRQGEGATEEEKALARELRNDLRYVQANYQIAARPLGDIQMVNPKGNLVKKR